MHFSEFTQKLKAQLQLPLPGDKVRRAMAPSIRFPEQFKLPDPTKARKAGVLLLIYPDQNDFFIPLMQRVEDGFAHSGQISFPGGGREKADTNIQMTALRETEEEFGVPRESVTVLGQLSELYIPVSNSLVYPVVGITPERPNFVPETKEVAAIIEVGLQHLMDKNIIQSKSMQATSKVQMTAAYYHLYAKHILWGATAMMMSEFLAIVDKVLSSE